MDKQFTLKDKIYNYPTKSEYGFVQSEINIILLDYPDINMEKFNKALFGNTCMVDEDNSIISYHCDIYKAIYCGIENMDLKTSEWD